MDLKDYFENTDGLGVLCTSDADGIVDCAIYAMPHVMDSETIAFIMRPRTSYGNIQANPNAVYMFIEKTAGYQGQRLYLQKTAEEKKYEKINLLRRSHHGGDESEAKLVYFKVIRIRPLVGDSEQNRS